MSDYRCIRSFYTSTNKKYYAGDLINSSTYYNLSSDCRRNFEEEDNSDLLSTATAFAIGEIFSSNDNSPSNDSFWSSSDDSSFGGFDRGDSGGGGASGDW